MGGRKLNITMSDITSALEGHTLTEAAKLLGIGRTTLVDRIREFGIGKGRGKYKRKYRRRRKRSAVHKKLVENTGTHLPADVRSLSKILALKPETIRAYLDRGRTSSERLFKEIIKDAPDDTVIKNIDGVSFPLGAVEKMSVAFDKWGRTVRIFCTLKTGTVMYCQYPVNDVWNLVEEK